MNTDPNPTTVIDTRRCVECGREWRAPMGSPFVCPGCGLTSTLLGTHPLPKAATPEAQQSILTHTITRTIAALEAGRNAADIIRTQHAEIERLRADLAAAKADIARLKRASDDQDRMDDSCGR